MKRSALAALAALGVAVFLVAGCAAVATSSRATRNVRVMVYNIHAGKDARNADNLERVAALLLSTEADIVLLQEVDKGTRRSGGVDQPAQLARLTGYHVAFGRSLDYQGGEYGIAIMSRWPITASITRGLPVEPPQERSGGSYEPRAAQLAIIAAPDGEIAVVNTHIDASGDDRWRRQEIRTILAISDSLLGAGATVLVGGDLNSTPESDVQVTLRARGLRDAWPICGSGPALTYPADSGVKRIDYLYFANPAVTCDDARVLRTDASDHSPLLVRVRFPADPG